MKHYTHILWLFLSALTIQSAWGMDRTWGGDEEQNSTQASSAPKEEGYLSSTYQYIVGMYGSGKKAAWKASNPNAYIAKENCEMLFSFIELKIDNTKLFNDLTLLTKFKSCASQNEITLMDKELLHEGDNLIQKVRNRHGYAEDILLKTPLDQNAMWTFQESTRLLTKYSEKLIALRNMLLQQSMTPSQNNNNNNNNDSQ